jgi:hypothetical protein
LRQTCQPVGYFRNRRRVHKPLAPTDQFCSGFRLICMSSRIGP